MKQGEKLAIMSLVALMILACYRPSMDATLLGHYRGTGYNFFAQLYQFLGAPDRFKAQFPTSLNTALTQHGITTSNTTQMNISAVLWGSLAEPDAAPADRIYNVVFHPDVLKWRSSDADVNTNILAGLFAPNGVATSNPPIAIDSLSALNVNKHDQIYYSPNNARFQLQPDRKIATFWTAGIASGTAGVADKSKAEITFNIMIDPSLLDQLNMSAALTGSPHKRTQQVVQALARLAATLNADDKSALENAITVLKNILQLTQPTQGGAANNNNNAKKTNAEEAEQRERERAEQIQKQRKAEQRAREEKERQAQEEQEQRERAERQRTEQIRLQREAEQQAQEAARQEQERRAAEQRAQQEATQRAQEQHQPAPASTLTHEQIQQQFDALDDLLTDW